MTGPRGYRFASSLAVFIDFYRRGLTYDAARVSRVRTSGGQRAVVLLGGGGGGGGGGGVGVGGGAEGGVESGGARGAGGADVVGDKAGPTFGAGKTFIQENCLVCHNSVDKTRVLDLQTLAYATRRIGGILQACG